MKRGVEEENMIYFDKKCKAGRPLHYSWIGRARERGFLCGQMTTKLNLLDIIIVVK